MDVTLQKHCAKHIYRIPEGLRELCADISREVLRAQPSEIYCFVADYIDALLITRENAKVAVRIVNNILLRSESIVDILRQSGLSLEQIAVAATRIQKAFRSYLDLVDVQQAGIYEEKKIDENSRICIRDILETTGTSWEQAEVAASTIQAAFRNHYKEMLTREAKGEVQWQRAVVNTIAILRKAGVSQEEAARAVTLIQSSYRGYYARRNIKLKILSGAAEEEGIRNKDVLEPRETIQAVAWMDMMFEDSKHTIEHANEAATIIQSAFRGYRARVHQQSHEHMSKVESSQSMVIEAIIDRLNQRIWSKVKSAEKFPEEFGSREELEETADKIQTEYKNRQRKIRISDQLKEDEVEEIGVPVAEQKAEVEATENIEFAKVVNEEKVQSGADAAQDFETAVENDLKEDKESSSAVIESETENESAKHEEHEGVAQVPEADPESVAEVVVKVEPEEHEGHGEYEEKESNDKEES